MAVFMRSEHVKKLLLTQQFPVIQLYADISGAGGFKSNIAAHTGKMHCAGGSGVG